jgi:hypothetical protein
MLERIRFQNIDMIVLKARDKYQIGERCYQKGQPILIIDNPAISSFNVYKNDSEPQSRGAEALTSVINRVEFEIVDGQIHYELWNSMFSEKVSSNIIQKFKRKNLKLESIDEIDFEEEIKGMFIYKAGLNGSDTTMVGVDEYLIDDSKVIFQFPITGDYWFLYYVEKEVSDIRRVKQVSDNMIASLEVQGEALDMATGEKRRIILIFPKVSVNVDLGIRFGADSADFTAIKCVAMPELSASGISKDIFYMVVE